MMGSATLGSGPPGTQASADDHGLPPWLHLGVVLHPGPAPPVSGPPTLALRSALLTSFALCTLQSQCSSLHSTVQVVAVNSFKSLYSRVCPLSRLPVWPLVPMTPARSHSSVYCGPAGLDPARILSFKFLRLAERGVWEGEPIEEAGGYPSAARALDPHKMGAVQTCH